MTTADTDHEPIPVEAMMAGIVEAHNMQHHPFQDCNDVDGRCAVVVAQERGLEIERLDAEMARLRADTVPMADMTRALDEIYLLRAALAYEARTVENHLTRATFPAGRRKVAEDQVARMQAAARGEAHTAYVGVKAGDLQRHLKQAGASGLLSYPTWKEERD